MADNPPPPNNNLGSILGGSGAALLSLASVVYAAINHKRMKAKCCGKVFEMEVDIGPTAEAPTDGATAPKESAMAPKESATAPKQTAKVHPIATEPDIEKGESA